MNQMMIITEILLKDYEDLEWTYFCFKVPILHYHDTQD
jgi:hypothetical protein